MSLSRLQIPYMTTVQREAIIPNNRDLVFDTDQRKIYVGDGTTLGGVSLTVDGAAGVGITWHGAYSGVYPYVINDLVSYNGSTYICILGSTGNLPSNVTYFSLVAQGVDATYYMLKASNLSDVSDVATARNNILPSKTGNSLKVLRVNSGETDYELTSMSAGDVVGPASATDNAVVRFDATTGKIIQDSAVTIADTTGDITGGKYNTVAISGTSTPTLAVTGTTTVSGDNTGDQTLPTDQTLAFTDVTNNNASTTAHGFAPKATAPASTFINVLGIGNAETVYSNKALFDATAPSTQAYGDAASAGTATVVARRDHKHAMPAAVTDSTISVTDITTNNASTTAHGFAPKVTAPAATFVNVLGVANGETVRADKALFDATVPSTQAYGDAASAGTSTSAARRDHKHAMPAAQHVLTAVWGDNFQTGSVVAGTVCYVRVPYGGTITSWHVVADVAITATMDIWKSNAAVPTVANTITAAAKPSLTTATTATSSTLTGWTTTVAVGDVFGFSLDTLTSGTPTAITLVLNIG